jgi:hypothetical protein
MRVVEWIFSFFRAIRQFADMNEKLRIAIYLNIFCLLSGEKSSAIVI